MLHTLRSWAGFTLPELMIALLIFSLITASVFRFFETQRDTYVREDLKLERDQNLRMALDTLVSELSTAGIDTFGSTSSAKLLAWVSEEYIPTVPMIVSFDANPKITLGEGDLPDMVTFLCLVPTRTNPTTLSEKADGDRLVLTLSRTGTAEQYREGDLLWAGYLPQYGKVVGIDGKTLLIDADPETSFHDPLATPCPAGALVGEVSIVSYAVFTDENDPGFLRHEAGVPVLKRKVNAAGFYPVADNISRMEISPLSGRGLHISLTAQTQAGYAGMEGRSPLVLSAEVFLRNTAAPVFADACGRPAPPGGISIHGGLDETYPCGVFLSWDPVTTDASGRNLGEAGCSVTGYRIYYDIAPGVFGNHLELPPESASGTLLDVGSLSPEKVYASVAAVNGGGVGEKSAEESVVDKTPPGRPKGVTAAKGAPREILLAWEENTECDLAGYLVFRKKGGGTFELIDASPIPKGAGEWADDGLEDGFLYSYVIEAVDFGFNRSEASDAVSVSLP